MKKTMIFVLVLVLCLGTLAGCRSRQEDMTTDTTATTADTMPDTGNILPDTGDMMPDTADTVDPSSGAEDGMVDSTNGANQDDTTGTTAPENRARRQPMG